MKELLFEYNAKKEKTFDDLLDFHYKFECIHPFQDGNGRIGRLLLFKECLKYNIVPFIIDEELKQILMKLRDPNVFQNKTEYMSIMQHYKEVKEIESALARQRGDRVITL